MEIEICRVVFVQQNNGNAWWEARQPTSSGQETVILKGPIYIDQYWKKANTWLGAMGFGNINQEIARSYEQQKSANLNLVAELAKSGWEPTTFDDKGLVTVLKRVKSASSKDKNLEPNQSIAPQKPFSEFSPKELLEQLATLRDAGILTQDEFDAKKAEILKRI